VGDAKGFLKIGRKPTPKRTIEERVQDYRYIYEPMPEEELKGRPRVAWTAACPSATRDARLGT
jgi:hypothetical protein